AAHRCILSRSGAARKTKRKQGKKVTQVVSRAPSRAAAIGLKSPGACQPPTNPTNRSEEHTSELQSRENLVCRLLLEKKKICMASVASWRSSISRYSGSMNIVPSTGDKNVTMAGYAVGYRDATTGNNPS